MKLQLYYDDAVKRDPTYAWEKRQTIDLDFQHRFGWTQWQEVTWGLGYRVDFDTVTETSIPPAISLAFDPARATSELFSGFLQDDITLKEDKLHLIVGTKLEHNDFSGIEVQPNIRLLWTPHKRHSLWAAVSRALRTPSRATSDLKFFLVPRTTLGNKDLKSSAVVAYEAGYRVRPLERVFLDVAAFYNVYDRLVVTEAVSPNVLVPTNKMKGETYGTEFTAAWSVMDWWRLESTYSFLRIFLHPDEDITNANARDAEGNSPRNQASLRSSMDLPGNTEFDLWLRYVENLPLPRVDSYVNLDARVAWEPVTDLELSLVGQNLLDKQRPEFNRLVEMQRGVYAKATWRF